MRSLDFSFSYVDDLLIASSSPDEHTITCASSWSVWTRMASPSTLQSASTSLNFLGHHVSSDGIRPLETNVEATTFPC